MNLADHIIAAPSTGFDLAGSFTSIARHVREAERFEMSDDVAIACKQLVDSKPSTLNAALPMCRLPYETMWIEYRGGVNADNNTRDPLTAPVPLRQGFLIQGIPGQSGRAGFATVVWVHKNQFGTDEIAPFTSPFAIYFDWNEGADVRNLIRESHELFLKNFPTNEIERATLQAVIGWMEKLFLGESKSDEIRRFFMIRHGWEKFANNEKEIEAMRQAENHMLAGLSPHGINLILHMAMQTFVNGNIVGAKDMMQNWLADIQGEGCFMECFLAMLNSRNCVEREKVDLSRLNRARHKRGKLPLLSYTKTKIVLSKSQARTAHARGMEREAARLHLVRGHFKIRRTGVYWWCPFARGDAKRGTIRRQEYDVGVQGSP